MSFWGKAFVFDDVPCENFDLIVYDIDGQGKEGGVFAGTSTIVEEHIPHRWRPLMFSTTLEQKLEFKFTFGVNEDRIDAGVFLDKYEQEAIAAWLTGHETYKWLAIEQDDMVYFRYRCVISSLEEVSFGDIPWAMRATVTCDGPFAYMLPQAFEIDIDGSTTYTLLNESSLNRFYEPKLIYEPRADGTLVISNDRDPGHVFRLTDMPPSVQSVTVDNENCVITNSADIDLYPYFNYNFFRLRRGYNTLTLTGHGKLTIVCEFPVNIGG